DAVVVVVLGKPVAMVAERVAQPCELERLANRLVLVSTLRRGGLIENGKLHFHTIFEGKGPIESSLIDTRSGTARPRRNGSARDVPRLPRRVPAPARARKTIRRVEQSLAVDTIRRAAQEARPRKRAPPTISKSRVLNGTRATWGHGSQAKPAGARPRPTSDRIAMHQGANAERTAPCADALVQAILDVLRLRTGCDFSRYRRATMHRRIRNRMIALGIASLPEYLARIEDAEDEALPLLERLTIKVSRFYRNRATFALLRTHVLPHLARDRGGAPLRMWSAGCGCGEEAYSLAMLLEEAALPGFVVASDIDPAALGAARAAAYPAEALAELPPELRERFLRARPDG